MNRNRSVIQNPGFQIIAVFVFFVSVAAGGLHSEKTGELVYAFRSFRDNQPQKMILVGEIRARTKAPELQSADNPHSNYDTRGDQAIIRLTDRRGIKEGQTLYIIDKDPHHRENRNGLIVGKVEVASVFHSPFYGWAVIGKGNLLRVREGLFAARTLETENLEIAYNLKKKGDYFLARGETEKAIASYSAAIEQDRNLPEAYAALGSLYLSMAKENTLLPEDPVRALNQLEQAYKSRRHFRYKSEESAFFLEYMDALMMRYEIRRQSASREEELIRIPEKVIALGNEARKSGYGSAALYVRLLGAHYRKFDYHRSADSPASRQERESSLIEILAILEALLDRPVTEAAFHRYSVLFFSQLLHSAEGTAASEYQFVTDKLYKATSYALYRNSRMIKESEYPEERLREMTAFHLEHYYLNLADGTEDPAVGQIRRTIKAETR